MPAVRLGGGRRLLRRPRARRRPGLPADRRSWRRSAPGSTTFRSRSSSRLHGSGCSASTQILERLERSLQLLTGGTRDAPDRQRTLAGAIGWSYDMLNEEEKQLFARASVFAGGCTLEAGQAVCRRRTWTRSRRSSTRASSGTAATASGCWRRSGSSPRSGSRRAGSASTSSACTWSTSPTSPVALERSFVGRRRRAGCQRCEQELDNIRAALTFSHRGR